jgi:predicted HD phosphohydrolase
VTLANLLVVVASVLAAYLAVVMGVYVALPLAQGAAWLVRSFVSPLVLTTSRMDVNARRRNLEADVARELGQVDPLGQRARADVVQAAVDAQRIRVLDRMFRSTVSQCVATHWSVASGLGATHMSEAARHPMCQGLRQRVIDLSEMLGDTIGRYPLLLDSPELVRLHVGLQRIAPTCIACPYWTNTVSQAPRLCPPARALDCGIDGKSSVVDAQILGGD